MRNAAAGLLIVLLHLVLCLSLPTPQDAEGLDSQNKNTDFCVRTDEGFLNHARRQFTQSMEKFTQSIYLDAAEKNPNSNFVFSPLSIHSALTMLYLGTTTNSTTEQELKDAMGMIASKETVQCGYKSIVDVYNQEKNFKYANKFWLQQGYDVNPNFKQKVEKVLNSGAENINFNAENSVDLVNSWVATMTNQKIKKMVEEFSSNTVLYLANALYFKEEWLVPFDDVNYDDTPLTGNFETPTGPKEVGMIQQINSNATYGEIKIHSDELVEVVSIPYKNDLFEMQIILPKNKVQFSRMEEKMKLSNKRDLTATETGYFNMFSSKKNEVIDELKEDISEVYLRLPTFQVRSDLDVVDSLKKLGAKRVFQAGAELAELGTGPLSVSKISHTALVEVSKEGTEGAAATGAEIVLLSSAFNDRLDIVVDRPFIFVVEDKKNKIPVLVGRVMDPTVKIP
jgi:serpin B